MSKPQMPLIKKVTFIDTEDPESAKLMISWSTKEDLVVDLSDIRKFVNDPIFFSNVKIDEWGHALEWPGGYDISADTLYESGRKESGLPTRSEFIEWLERNHLTLTSAAKVLGLSRRTITYYKSGELPVPVVVGLACKGWESEHPKAA
jgi:hypothetical protein